MNSLSRRDLRRTRRKRGYLGTSRLCAELLNISCALLLATSSCARKNQTGTYVARINDQYLTAEKVKGSLDTVAHATEPQVRDFVGRWVNSALLYEEAKAQGLDQSAQVNETLEEMRRELAVDRLLETEVYTNQSLQASDEEIKAYYDQHKGDYLLAEDVVKIRYGLFANRDAAARLRSQLVKGKVWEEVFRNLSEDSSFTSAVIGRVDSEYIKRSTSPSTELWKVVAQLRVDELSAVTKDDIGYYVASLLAMRREGEIAELPSVVAEIRDRVLIEKRQRTLSQLLERLKKKYTVQVNLAALEGTDTTRGKK